MGNLTALFPPEQGTDGAAWMYRYDFFDRLIETKDPLGNIWRKEWNLAGAVLREATPDGSVERLFYDGNGNLVKKVLPESYDPETDDGPGLAYEYDSECNKVLEKRGLEKVRQGERKTAMSWPLPTTG